MTDPKMPAVADESGEVRNQKLDPEAEARRRLALAQVRQYPDPVLRMRAREVEDFDDDLTSLVERMRHLLHDANGLGLAATQVGVLRRVFLFLPDPEQEAVAISTPIAQPATTRSTSRAPPSTRRRSGSADLPRKCKPSRQHSSASSMVRTAFATSEGGSWAATAAGRPG